MPKTRTGQTQWMSQSNDCRTSSEADWRLQSGKWKSLKGKFSHIADLNLTKLSKFELSKKSTIGFKRLLFYKNLIFYWLFLLRKFVFQQSSGVPLKSKFRKNSINSGIKFSKALKLNLEKENSVNIWNKIFKSTPSMKSSQLLHTAVGTQEGKGLWWPAQKVLSLSQLRNICQRSC